MTCELCNDLQWVRADLPLDDPQFGSLVPCTCLQESRRRRRREACLGKRLAEYTFQNYRVSTKKEQDAWTACHALLLGTTASVLLYGQVGRGKTHLLAATVSEALESIGAQFWVVPDLAGAVKRRFKSDDAEEFIDEIQRYAGLLALDDLGAEQDTEWTQSMLYRIVNRRYNDALPTIISSNTPPDKLDARLRRRLAQGTVIQL